MEYTNKLKSITLNVEFGHVSDNTKEKILSEIMDSMRFDEKNKKSHIYDYIKGNESISYYIDYSDK